MRILLVSNPKETSGYARMIKFPNLGLASIAGNLDRNICDVKILDLSLYPSSYMKVLMKTLKDYQPGLVGFSCMIFQYHIALDMAKAVKTHNKNTIIVMGGYSPTLLYKEILCSDDRNYIDFLIRGEGEVSFGELIRQIKGKKDYSAVPGLSFKDGNEAIHNPPGKLIDLGSIKRPDRDARIIKKGFHLFGYPVDAVETSRGCMFDCNFCSITQMYGKSYRRFSIERTMEELRELKMRGNKAVLFIDDNITLDTGRLEELCKAMTAEKPDLHFFVQASVQGLKKQPSLPRIMKQAGARWVFLGIENVSDSNLQKMQKSNQFSASDTYDVVRELKSHGITVIGGFIFGYPDDSEETLMENYRFAVDLKLDLTMFNIITPFPGAGIREELLEQGLITNITDYRKYNLYSANVKTKHLTTRQLSDIRNKMEFKFYLEYGALWKFIRKEPAYMSKMLLSQIFVDPREFLKYSIAAVGTRR